MCTTSALYVLLLLVVYKRMPQSASRTPICRYSMVNHMFRNTFPMRNYCIIHLSLGDQCNVYHSALVCTSCTRRVQENAAIGLVVLQSAEILGLIICFAIHLL